MGAAEHQRRPAAVAVSAGEVVHFDGELLHLAQAAVHLVHQGQVWSVVRGVQAAHRFHPRDLQAGERRRGQNYRKNIMFYYSS